MEFYISGKRVSRETFRKRLYSWIFDHGRETVRDICQRLRDGEAEEFSSIIRDDEAGDTCFSESFHVLLK